MTPNLIWAWAMGHEALVKDKEEGGDKEETCLIILPCPPCPPCPLHLPHSPISPFTPLLGSCPLVEIRSYLP